MNLLFVLILLSHSVYEVVTSSSEYTHSLDLLDDIFHIFWKYDTTTITFEIHAKTLGWVGFGLTPDGGMARSDITITWVKDGQTFFSVSSDSCILLLFHFRMYYYHNIGVYNVALVTKICRPKHLPAAGIGI